MKSKIIIILLFITYSLYSADGLDDTLWVRKTEIIRAIATHPSKPIVLSGCGGQAGFLSIWNIETGEETRIAHGKFDGSYIVFSPSGKLVAYQSYTKFRILDTETWQEVALLDPGEVSSLGGIFFTDDEKKVWLAKAGELQLWELESKQIIKRINNFYHVTQDNPSGKIGYDNLLKVPNKNQLVFNGWPKTRFIDLDTYETVDSTLMQVMFTYSKNGKYLAIYNLYPEINGGKVDLVIKDLIQNKIIHTIVPHGQIWDFKFSNDEKYFIYTCENVPNITFLNLETGQFKKDFINDTYTFRYIGLLNNRLFLSLHYFFFNFKFPPTNTSIPSDNPENIVYPNPSNGLVNIIIPNNTLTLSGVIRNNQGRDIMNLPHIPVQNNLVNINISHLPAGNYFLTLTDTNFNKTYKIIKGL